MAYSNCLSASLASPIQPPCAGSSFVGQMTSCRNLFACTIDRESILSIGIVPEKKLLVDMDSTVCTVYGDQEGAMKGYNPRARGRKSYHPLFCFESASGTSFLGLLRHGNAYTSSGAKEYLERFFGQFPETEYTVRFRGDSGFYDKAIITLLHRKKAGFAIVADMTGPLKHLVTSLKICQRTERIIGTGLRRQSISRCNGGNSIGTVSSEKSW